MTNKKIKLTPEQNNILGYVLDCYFIDVYDKDYFGLEDHTTESLAEQYCELYKKNIDSDFIVSEYIDFIKEQLKHYRNEELEKIGA